MGRPLLSWSTFKSVATTVLKCSEGDADAISNYCRAVGSKNVTVDTVEQLFCIELERLMVQILLGCE
jgi:hypothetical protein